MEFLMPSALDLLRFTKKETVSGISEYTQGISTAPSPASRPRKNFDHGWHKPSASSCLSAATTMSSIFLAGFGTMSALGSLALFTAATMASVSHTQVAEVVVVSVGKATAAARQAALPSTV